MKESMSFDDRLSALCQEKTTKYQAKIDALMMTENLQEYCGFSDKEFKLFKACFAYYLHFKENKLIDEFMNDRSIFYAGQIPVLGYFIKIAQESGFVEQAVVKRLNEQKNQDYNFYCETQIEGSTNPVEINSAANYISTWYLENQQNRGNFQHYLEKKHAFFERYVLRETLLQTDEV